MDTEETKSQVYLLAKLWPDLRVSLCVISPDKHRIMVTEIHDNSFFFNFEAMLLQNIPDPADSTEFKVVFFKSKKDKNDAKFSEIFNLNNIPYDQGELSKLADMSSQRSILHSIIKDEQKTQIAVSQFEHSLDLATYAYCHFSNLATEVNTNRYDLKHLELSRHLRLDSSLFRALDLLSFTGNRANDKSVFSVIDKTKTAMGQRCLRRWLMQPLAVREDIEDRQAAVGFLVGQEGFRGFVQNSFLSRMPNLELIAAKFYRFHSGQKSSCGLVEVVKVYQVVNSLRVLKAFFDGYECTNEEREGIKFTIIEPIEMSIKAFDKYTEFVEKYVDLDRQKRTGEVVVLPAVCSELDIISEKLKNIEKDVQSEIKQFEEDTGSQASLERNIKGEYLILANKKVEKMISQKPSLAKKYKVSSVRANNMRLTSDKLKRLAEQNISLNQEYTDVQKETVKRVLKIACSYYPAMEELGEIIGELDAFCSLGQFSISTLDCPRTKPVINSGERISFRLCRHPVLERFGDGCPVANDCVMNKVEGRFHIITGPNMGGKSTFIRQVAINLILGHMGCFVCAEAASIPIFDSIISRVGAGDIQSRGVSTWMAELLEVSCMLETATENTFMIVDELGRGTATSEGVGMTWAVSEHIINQLKGYCLFATHFFELTKLADSYEQAKNYHVQSDIKDGQIEMNYKIIAGSADKSYGIHVLELLKFPASITKFAQGIERSQTTSQIVKKEEETNEKMNLELNPNMHPVHHGLSLEAKVAALKAFKSGMNQIARDNAYATSESKDRLRQQLKSMADNYCE